MNTGGPAFPVPDSHHANGQVQYGANGMTLLDWFAGQALAGLVSESGRYDAAGAALDAYNLAAAMLAEKARREADHSGAANKMVEDHFRDAAKMTKLEAQREADHSEDKLGKVVRPAMGLECVANERNQALDQLAALEAANRELVKELELLVCASEAVQSKGYSFAQLIVGVAVARAVLAKHKEIKL